MMKAFVLKNKYQKKNLLFANWLIRRGWFVKRKQTESRRTAQSSFPQPSPDSANRYLPGATSIVYDNDCAT